MPSRRASALTARASPAEARRKPWSTVTASSFGATFSRPCQRAMSSSSPVESGPPETARTRVGKRRSEANSAFASAAETGAAASAVDTLLFSLDPLLHPRRRAGEFARHFAERCAGRLLLAERGERLSQPQKRVGGLGDGFMFGRDVEEGFRGIAKALPLEHAFTQPIRRVADEPIIGISAQERAEGVFGEGIVLAQHISVGEVVYVARGLRRWKRGKRAVADSGVARRWPGHSAVGRRDGSDIERRGGGGVHRPQRVRRTGRVRVLQGVEGVAAPAGRCGGRRGRILRARLHGRSRRALLLHAADLAFELLVAKLQLLNRSGQLPNLAFQPLDVQHGVGAGDLPRAVRARGWRAALAA